MCVLAQPKHVFKHTHIRNTHARALSSLGWATSSLSSCTHKTAVNQRHTARRAPSHTNTNTGIIHVHVHTHTHTNTNAHIRATAGRERRMRPLAGRDRHSRLQSVYFAPGSQTTELGRRQTERRAPNSRSPHFTQTHTTRHEPTLCCCSPFCSPSTSDCFSSKDIAMWLTRARHYSGAGRPAVRHNTQHHYLTNRHHHHHRGRAADAARPVRASPTVGTRKLKVNPPSTRPCVRVCVWCFCSHTHTHALGGHVRARAHARVGVDFNSVSSKNYLTHTRTVRSPVENCGYRNTCHGTSLAVR